MRYPPRPHPIHSCPRRRCQRAATSRRGTIVILTAILMIVLMCLLAFAVDIGYVLVARTELQRTADAAALAAAWEMVEDSDASTVDYNARNAAQAFVSLNKVCTSAPAVDRNSSNNSGGDIVLGTISDFSSPNMTTNDPNSYNAVRVHVKRTVGQNGEVPLFFARAMGFDTSATFGEATAGLIKRVRGFRKLPNQRLGFLPITYDLQTWDEMMADWEDWPDDWTWDESTQTISQGSDGIPELDLYPQDVGAPGNRGTVNIGTNNNSTSHLSSQIRNGLSESDLDFHGGELKLDSTGELSLEGDPGISAAIKDDLQSIAGEPRVIPLFEDVAGNGNNAQYTIVRFVGIRIMEVKLTGNNKRVMIQPARVVMTGTISGGESNSHWVYSVPHLVK